MQLVNGIDVTLRLCALVRQKETDRSMPEILQAPERARVGAFENECGRGLQVPAFELT